MNTQEIPEKLVNGLIEYAVRECCRGVYWRDLRSPFNPPGWLVRRVLFHAIACPDRGPYAITGVINAELEALYGLFQSLHLFVNADMAKSIATFGRLELE